MMTKLSRVRNRNPSRSEWGRVRTAIPSFVKTPAFQLALVLVGSEALYVALLRLDARNGLEPMVRFLSIMGLLFVLYAVGTVIVKRGAGLP